MPIPKEGSKQPKILTNLCEAVAAARKGKEIPLVIVPKASLKPPEEPPTEPEMRSYPDEGES